MSQILAASLAGKVRRIVKHATEQRRAIQREKEDPVHRDAVDYLDLEARRSRRLNQSSFEDELDHHKAALGVVEGWQAKSVAEGPPRYRGVFGVHGVATFRLLLRDMASNGDGRADLAYSQVAEAIGQGTGTVFHRFHDLIAAGVIDYQPRSIVAGVDGRGRGLRLQMSSVSWLTPSRLPDEWRRLFAERLEHYREQRAARIRRQQARARLQQVCEQKAHQAREGGSPERQRKPVRTFDPLKVNPRGMRRLADATTERTHVAATDEQRDADRVRTHLDELMAAAAAQCG